MLDAKAALDGQLRSVINDFVSASAAHILAPLSPETIAAGTKPNVNEDDRFDALKAVRTVRGLAEKNAPLLRSQLRAFLPDDVRTLETLVLAVRDQVVLGYEEFFDDWIQRQGGERRVSRKGKGRENDVLGPEVFGEIVGRVFDVGALEEVGDGSDDDDSDDRR